MGFLDDVGGWVTENVGKPVGQFFGDVGDWLGERSTNSSNVGDANRMNFVTPGGADRANRLLALAQGYDARQAPQAADSSFRADQEALINRLRGQMNGQDSLADLQLRQAT